MHWLPQSAAVKAPQQELPKQPDVGSGLCCQPAVQACSKQGTQASSIKQVTLVPHIKEIFACNECLGGTDYKMYSHSGVQGLLTLISQLHYTWPIRAHVLVSLRL